MNEREKLKAVIAKHREEFISCKMRQVIPDHTCPIINGVLRETGDNRFKCDCRDLIETRMEDIRQANIELRNLGVLWYEFARDLIDDLEMTVKLEERK